MGKLRWLEDQTRPDISYDELVVSTAQSKVTYKDVKHLNKMVQQVKGYDVRIKYDKLKGTRGL